MFSLLVYVFYAHSQTYSDTLKKFSYLLYGYKMVASGETIQSQGTGFFFRESDNIYFVTAEHVVNGCIKQIKDTLQPDAMLLWQNAQAPYKEWYIKFDTKIIRDTSICKNHRLSPDIFIYRVNKADSVNIKINYVSDYFSDLPISSKSILFYGFPTKNRDENKNPFDQTPTIFTSQNFQVRNSLTRFKNQDIINYYVDIKDQKLDSSFRGFSGAPVFVIDKSKEMPVFLGIMSGYDTTTNTFLVVKRIYLLESIYEYETRRLD